MTAIACLAAVVSSASILIRWWATDWRDQPARPGLTTTDLHHRLHPKDPR